MKKIGGKSFWIILIISIVSLIILTVGVIFLTRKNSKEFYSAGYIISSSATKSDKLYFNDNTVYKENVFNEYVFKNTEDKEVTTDKNNFIHYLDNSLSFMKNGVILDLDNINTSLVPYYNITDASIIKYNNGGYYIETADKTLTFGNFLGKITDNKYIVVGKDIKIKLAGSNDVVSGDYFEILFVEDGVVKIENQEGSYQTVSDDTVIYVGNKIKINLGDKNVLLDEEKKLSLNEMTIDGNENINIVPDEGKVKEEKDNTGDNSGEGGTGEIGDGTSGGGTGTEGGTGDGTGEGDETGEIGDGTSGGGTTQTVIKKEVSIDLVSAKAGINTIETSFQVIDTDNFIKGNLLLTLKNVSTGEIVYKKILANASDVQDVNISSLSPNTNYVMTIVEENNSTSIQHFQKIFKTDSLDLKLVRELVTTDSLSYSIDFGSTDVKSVNVSIYNSEGEKLGNTVTINSTDENKIVEFKDLNRNTLYNIKVDSVVFNNYNYADTYTINTSDNTLKLKPTLGDISVKVSSDGKEFTLLMEEPIDEDKSITKYTYEIYNASDITESENNIITPVYSFSSDELKEQKIKLGSHGIESNTDYRFKVIVQYNDNYKYNEIDTAYSNYFQIVGKPTVEFTPDEELISFNQIGGIVEIKDEGCTIPNTGRECFDQENNFTIKYYGPDKIKKTIENVTFNDKMQYNLILDELSENTLYNFELYADVDMKNGENIKKGEYIGSFTAKTSGIKALKMQNWKSLDYSFEIPISVNTEMISTDPSDDSVDKIASITFNLYRGDVLNGITTEPIGTFTTTENIKDKYYNKEFNINTSMFGIENLDSLRELSGGRLNKYYTIEITDAYDASMTNKFNIIDNMYVFETPTILLLEDEVDTPTIVVDEITNVMTKSNEYKEEYGITYDAFLDEKTIRGYKITAVFDKQKIGNYFQGDNPVRAINFYAYNSKGSLIETKEVSLIDSETKEVYFFLGTGTDSAIVDKDLRRGNTYTFSYDLQLDTDNDGTSDKTFPSNKPKSEGHSSIKKDPEFKLYIDNSSKDSITYKYKISDYDNALLKSGENYELIYMIGEEDKTEHIVPITSSDDYSTFTLTNLKNSDIYNIMYQKVSVKDKGGTNKVSIGKYYFDGYYNGNDFNMGYLLEYGNFDNRLKIIVDDNEFLNRVSAYLITLTAGENKYQKVISSFNTNDIKSCGDRNCVIIDYADIADFKGKDITVSVVAFYDTGYIGFSQKSLLGDYFKSINIVDDTNKDKVGFVYQNTSIMTPGQYIYFLNKDYNAFISSKTPMGILGYEFKLSNATGVPSKLTTVNLVDISGKKFVNYGDISKETNATQMVNGVYESNEKNTINPKVLDKVNIVTDNSIFKFTSITPKVTSTASSLINGAKINIDLSVDENTLNTDFVKTDNKYKFYIDIYKETTCPEEDPECTVDLEHIKTVETDYDNISEVTFDGLDPDTIYKYKISADMNKNGTKVKTPLFDYKREGYVEYINSFKTLGKNDIYASLNYNYSSDFTDTIYNNRILNINTKLKTDTNMNIKYQIFANEEELKYEKIISRVSDEIIDCKDNPDDCTNKIYTNKINQYNNDIRANYSLDITGDDFVFGSGYYTIKIYAVTTDLDRELELYTGPMTGDNVLRNGMHELSNPDIKISQEAIMDEEYKHSIKYSITVEDKDKVINNGKYEVELQNSAYSNACGEGHENDCKVIVDMSKNPSCKFVSGANSCTVVSKDSDKQVVEIVFDNLTADTPYVIYTYANTHRNNIDLEEKDSLVYVRKSQYTKSNLGFSLGAVTPTAVTKNRVLLTFVGAANINKSLRAIEYTITVQGGDIIKSGSIAIGNKFGLLNETVENFKSDKDNYPYLEIPILDGKTLGVNNTINIIYHYIDKEGNIKVLNLSGKTVFDYTFKNENK